MDLDIEEREKLKELRDMLVAEVSNKLNVSKGNIINDDMSPDTVDIVVLLPGTPEGGFNLRGEVLDLINKFEPCILLDTTEHKLAMGFHVRHEDLEKRYRNG